MGCRSWGVRGARWGIVTGYPHHGHVHPHGHDPLALLKCGRFERHLHFPLEGAVTSMQRKVGETLRGKTECIAYNNPGIIELETRYSDEVGNEVLHERSTLIVSGETNGNEVETSRSGSGMSTGHSKQESVLHYECNVDRLAIAWMAVALEDPNLIHVEDRVAQEAGFPTVIAHGTFPIGAIGAMLAQWAGEENVLELDIRLVAPTFPGNSIVGEGSILERVDNKQTIEVVVRQKDQIVARGRAIVNAQESQTLRPNSFVQEDLP